MIKIENLTININKMSLESEEELLDSKIPAVVRDELVSTLRIISEDTRFEGQTDKELMKDLVNGLIDKANIENNNETKIDSKLF